MRRALSGPEIPGPLAKHARMQRMAPVHDAVLVRLAYNAALKGVNLDAQMSPKELRAFLRDPQKLRAMISPERAEDLFAIDIATESATRTDVPPPPKRTPLERVSARLERAEGKIEARRLEVSEQAEKIEFANQYTSVALALIPSGEDTVYNSFESRGIIVDDLFSLVDRIREQFEEAGVLLGNG